MSDSKEGKIGSLINQIGGFVGKKVGTKMLGAAIGRALGAALGSIAPGIGNIIGGILGGIIGSKLGKFVKIVFFIVIGAIVGPAVVLVIVIMVPIMIIMLGLGGGGLGPDTVEGAPLPGTGTGLVADYCIKVNVADPPYPDDPDTPEDETRCSDDLREIFEAAGAWAKVPAGVIAGVASIEGRQLFGYTDDEIAEYGAFTSGSGILGQGIDPANSSPNYCGAIGPMQMLIDGDTDYPSWTNTCPNSAAVTTNTWTQGGEPTKYKDAANLALQMDLANPDARNIRNAIYGAAWKLKCEVTSPGIASECHSGVFTKYDYNDESDDWEGPPDGEEKLEEEEYYEGEGEADGSAGEAWLAAKGYYGSCADDYCIRVWEYYKATKNTSATGSGGAWGWPNSGRIDQGPYQSPSHNVGRQRSAVDIKNDIGEPVYATTDGNLIFKGYDSSGALDVALKTSTYQVWYVHLSGLSPCIDALSIGDFVPAGELIGFVGNTGQAYLPHTHYNVRTLSRQAIPEDEFRNLLPKPDIQVGDNVTTGYNGVNCQP